MEAEVQSAWAFSPRTIMSEREFSFSRELLMSRYRLFFEEGKTFATAGMNTALKEKIPNQFGQNKTPNSKKENQHMATQQTPDEILKAFDNILEVWGENSTLKIGEYDLASAQALDKKLGDAL